MHNLQKKIIINQFSNANDKLQGDLNSYENVQFFDVIRIRPNWFSCELVRGCMLAVLIHSKSEIN